METFTKTRIEITIEAPILSRITHALDMLPVTGYSVLPVMAGKGHEDFQEIRGKKLAFRDADHAALALATRATRFGGH